MESKSPTMPRLMQEFHKLPVDYLGGEGIDFEPYGAFLSVEKTQAWFRAWMRNPEANGGPYAIFGQDGTGGYAALWLVRESEDLLDQPIVFFGSEGELGVIAQNFSDYLWLLAAGHGPYEAVASPDDEKAADTVFLEFAQQNSITSQAKPSEIISRAAAEYPTFEKDIQLLCQ